MQVQRKLSILFVFRFAVLDMQELQSQLVLKTLQIDKSHKAFQVSKEKRELIKLLF